MCMSGGGDAICFLEGYCGCLGSGDVDWAGREGGGLLRVRLTNPWSESLVE